MNYPFTLFIPLLLSTVAQGVLWAGYLFFIPWMDRLATFWIAAGSAAAALIFLVLYRLVATDMKPWNLALLFCSIMQFAALGSSGYFIWLIMLSAR